MNDHTEKLEQNSDAEWTVDASFAHLENCVRQLSRIAPVATPGQLRKIVADVPDDAKRLVLVELIKWDMSAAAQQKIFRPVEFYRTEFCDWLPEGQPPIDLVLEELHLGRELGQALDLTKYQAQYPEMIATIERRLADDQATERLNERCDLPDLEVGGQIDDFRLLSVLGEGAFARVFLAFQESLHRLVALKVTQKGSDEPQALSQLDHPNIVRVYDQRVCRQPPAHLLYMQYVPGGTLADLIALVRDKPIDQRIGKCVLESVDRALERSGQAPVEESIVREKLRRLDWVGTVAWIGTQLAEGLDYAHARGVLHRDIKPANILLSSSAVPQLADFNVSFSGVAGRAGAAVYFGGSLAYMSPEQLEVADPFGSLSADELDGRSDIYALGIVLWELWQGTRPWSHSGTVHSWPEAIAVQATARRTPLPEIPNTGQPASQILAKALKATLSLKPDDRPKNGAELADRLRIALNSEAASLLEPDPRSWLGRLRTYPVIFVAALLVIVPNAVFGVINYNYNFDAIVDRYSTDLQETFRFLAWVINGLFFPVGAVFLMLFARPVQKALDSSSEQSEIGECQWRAIWLLGHRSALIGGVMWSVAGTLFPLVLWASDPNFSRLDTLHFIASHAVCGGVAWICPFFGLTLAAVGVYYPFLLSTSDERCGVLDPGFAMRRRQLEVITRWYLVSSAAIPLLALVLLVLRSDAQRHELLMTICFTAIALLTAFVAHRQLERTLSILAHLHGDRK